MHTTGLLGAVRSAAGAATKVDPLSWIVRLVFVAGGMYIYMHSGAPTPGWMQVAVVIVLGVAALAFEYLATHNIVRAWVERSGAGIICWGIIWVGAFAYGSNAWLGAASEGQEQKAALHKAEFIEARNVVADEDSARGKVVQYTSERDRIRQERWAPLPSVAGNPVQSASQAEELLKGYESNTRFFTQLTAGCTKTVGPETRKFCKEHAEAKAAVAAATAREVKAVALEAAEKNLQQAEAALKEITAKREGTKVVTTEGRSDLHMLTAYMGVSETAAKDIQAVLKVAVISLFISLTGFLKAMEEYRNVPRRPWALVSFVKRIIFGAKADAEPARTVMAPAAPVKADTAAAHSTPPPSIVVANVEEALRRWAQRPEAAAVAV